MFAIFQVRTTGAELSDIKNSGEFMGIISWTYNFNISLILEQLSRALESCTENLKENKRP